ncbi:SRPBCC family protein [Nonomuraea wenchangensis]|uniref:SRPBCC family protein n=1 Tax=Nonomuraea wenchangensis TaxID=568860 RepID=UPI0034053DC6
MTSIRHEIVIDASPAHIWEVLRDVGAVHERLLPGRVADTRLEGDQRFLTFPDGHVVRELIVAIDDDARYLAYSVVEGARPALEHHHASFEVHPEGDTAGRLIWTTNVLPHTRAAEIRIRVEHGAREMKQAIEGAERGRRPRSAWTP